MATNVDIIRKLYETTKEGDIEYAKSVLHPDMVLYECESLPYRGVHHGLQGFLKVVEIAMQTWKDLQIVPKQFIDADDYVIVMVRLIWTNQKTGEPAETDLAEFWKFKDGKIIEILPFYWDTAAMLKTLS